MPMRNGMYRGPEIMIQLMRATNIPWQVRSIRNGYLISNGQYREQFKSTDAHLLSQHPGQEVFKSAEANQFGIIPRLEADTKFGDLSERELRNRHSISSRKSSGEVETPHSKYVSLTSSTKDTSWGEGSNPTIVFKFNVWRSDLWKGKHDLNRDPELKRWLDAQTLGKTPAQKDALLLEQTPADWDRGAEFEWLAQGGTKVYNVQESTDGKTWKASTPARKDIDVWWDAFV